MGPVNSPSANRRRSSRQSLLVANYAHHVAYGQVALDRIGFLLRFVPGLHSIGDLDPMRRYIRHSAGRLIGA